MASSAFLMTLWSRIGEVNGYFFGETVQEIARICNEHLELEDLGKCQNAKEVRVYMKKHGVKLYGMELCNSYLDLRQKLAEALDAFIKLKKINLIVRKLTPDETRDIQRRMYYGQSMVESMLDFVGITNRWNLGRTTKTMANLCVKYPVELEQLAYCKNERDVRKFMADYSVPVEESKTYFMDNDNDIVKTKSSILADFVLMKSNQSINEKKVIAECIQVKEISQDNQ